MTIEATRISYKAYSVAKREGDKDFWTDIGAAFAHRDGDGYSIVLNALPMDGRIVLRPAKTGTSRRG